MRGPPRATSSKPERTTNEGSSSRSRTVFFERGAGARVDATSRGAPPSSTSIAVSKTTLSAAEVEGVVVVCIVSTNRTPWSRVRETSNPREIKATSATCAYRASRSTAAYAARFSGWDRTSASSNARAGSSTSANATFSAFRDASTASVTAPLAPTRSATPSPQDRGAGAKSSGAEPTPVPSRRTSRARRIARHSRDPSSPGRSAPVPASRRGVTCIAGAAFMSYAVSRCVTGGGASGDVAGASEENARR